MKSFTGEVNFFNTRNGVIDEAYLIGLRPIRKKHGELEYPLYNEYKKISEKDDATESEKARTRGIGGILNMEQLQNPEYTLNYIAKKIDFVDEIHRENLSIIE